VTKGSEMAAFMLVLRLCRGMGHSQAPIALPFEIIASLKTPLPNFKAHMPYFVVDA
jgi:hypothetical protein